MTNGRTTATAIVAAATFLTLSGAAVAQTGTGRTATQSDFDVCNREAQIARGSITGGGAASPSTAPGATSGPTMGGTATGSVSGGPASGPTGAAGATGATGSLSGGSTLSSGGGAAGGDVQLRGMAAGSASDAAYQQAYRDCMRRRGF